MSCAVLHNWCVAEGLPHPEVVPEEEGPVAQNETENEAPRDNAAD